MPGGDRSQGVGASGGESAGHHGRSPIDGRSALLGREAVIERAAVVELEMQARSATRGLMGGIEQWRGNGCNGRWHGSDSVFRVGLILIPSSLVGK